VAVDGSFWDGRRVLVTGHTGFKGAWLCFWLRQLGATVHGIALPPATEPSLYDLLDLRSQMKSEFFDICDRVKVTAALDEFRPEVVFHLAAQSLVRASYEAPIETFQTNVVGTVTLLDVVRSSPSVSAVVVVTSDKCYENRGLSRGYRESDRMGGRDPYSASKGCTEIAARSMQLSYFAPYAPLGHRARIATVRAGNVIGGGDWSRDRIVPDLVRGCLGPSGVASIRNPLSVRPWQHVLDPLAGYLILASKLAESQDGVDEAWNFGPDRSEDRTVAELAEAFIRVVGHGSVEVSNTQGHPHEAKMLRLDSDKARSRLGWSSLLSFNDAVQLTADWYAAWQAGSQPQRTTRNQIDWYSHRAKEGISVLGRAPSAAAGSSVPSELPAWSQDRGGDDRE
jgi:CDP-glucose 4,6-dehydratase